MGFQRNNKNIDSSSCSTNGTSPRIISWILTCFTEEIDCLNNRKTENQTHLAEKKVMSKHDTLAYEHVCRHISSILTPSTKKRSSLQARYTAFSVRL